MYRDISPLTAIYRRSENATLNPVHTSNNVEATFDFVAKNDNDVEATNNEVASY